MAGTSAGMLYGPGSTSAGNFELPQKSVQDLSLPVHKHFDTNFEPISGRKARRLAMCVHPVVDTMVWFVRISCSF
eukprot:1440201-Amphidinium_carterae.1